MCSRLATRVDELVMYMPCIHPDLRASASSVMNEPTGRNLLNRDDDYVEGIASVEQIRGPKSNSKQHNVTDISNDLRIL